MRSLTLALLLACSLQAQYVKIAPYSTPGVGTDNITGGAGTTSIDILNTGLTGRMSIPFTTNIYNFQVYIPTTIVSSITAIYFFSATCATNSGNACLTWTPHYTASFSGAGITGNAINTFTPASPLAVTKWDVLGMRIEMTSLTGTTTILSAQEIPSSSAESPAPTYAGEVSYYQLNAAKQSTFTITSMTQASNNDVVVIGAYAIPAQVLFIGDSFIGGAPTPSDSFADWPQLDYPIPAVYGPGYFWMTSYAQTPVYQSMGRGGETSTQILARFTTDAINLQPAMVFLDAGINDLNSVCTNTGCTGPQIATIESNLASMMSSLQSNNIRCFILTMGPWQGSNATNAIMANEDTINANTISVAPGYGCTVIDWRTACGQFRAGGNTGNLWNWQSGCGPYADGLSIHPNQTGMGIIGGLIFTAWPSVLPAAPSNFSPIRIK